MDKLQHSRIKRRFPVNLYNKLEEKLKNKSEDTPETAEEEKPERVEKSEDTSLVKCPKCGKMVERARVVKKKYVCYECGGYFRVKTNNRIRMVADIKTFEPWFE
ncbi:MAG: acetyl-CoA carboxylase carboxyl transferase subunit beta, partial [Lachnospiraceae bacterium]|nr:acetyl-CoA carboxylase carboxyl transferase subunit beta [Lachnospiraceae bacterium]